MYGIRVRDLEGRDYQLGIDGALFCETASDVDEWFDVRGGYAVAGLVDAHAHLTASSVETMATGMPHVDRVVRSNALQQIDHGVLLVADKGTRADTRISIDSIPVDQRPELVQAGPIVTVEHGYYPDFGLVVDPAVDPIGWVHMAEAPDVSWLKLIGDWPRKGQGPLSNFTQEQLARIVVVAHGRGLRVAIHAAAPSTASQAVAAGVDSIEHGLFLTESDLQVLGERGGAWVPTIAAMEGLRDMLGPESSGGRLMARGLDNVRDLISLALGLGVNVLAGTDLHIRHGHIHKEVDRMIDYGMTPEAALQSVTTRGYEYLGVDRGFGAGQVADVVVLRGDPREDMSVLAKPVMIIRRGRVVVAP